MSHASVAAPDQVVANGGQVGARLTTPQGSQAFRDARTGLAVTENSQRRLQALKVIDRKQDDLRLTVAGQGDPLISRWLTRLASSERRALASDNGTDVTAIIMVRSIDLDGLHFGPTLREAAAAEVLNGQHTTLTLAILPRSALAGRHDIDPAAGDRPHQGADRGHTRHAGRGARPAR